MSKLSQVYQRTVASLQQAEQRAALEELREDLAGPLSDTAIAIDEASASAAQNLAAVAQAVSEAKEYESDARTLRTVEQETTACREAMEMVNNNGGFTLESLGYAHRALRAALAPVQVMPTMQSPALEAFDDGKQTIGLEGIDELLSQIESVRGEVEAKSIDGILRVLDALKTAGPEVKDRLVAMQQALPDVTYDENAKIRVDDLIFKALAVDGRLPTGVKDFAESYAAFANTMLSSFSENALVSAAKAGEIGSTIGGLAETACPIEALIKFIKDVGDPRDGIDADKLNFVLPGSGPLFGDAMDPTAGEGAPDAAPTEGVSEPTVSAVDNAPVAPAVEGMDDGDAVANELISRLTKFAETRVPLDPISWAERADAPAEVTTIRALSKDSIAGAIAALIKALEIVDPKVFGDANRQTWVQARSAFAAYQQGKNQLQAAQAAALSSIDGPLATYLDTVFELSAWPALHVLTNVVFTANAFLLLAERSIAGETEPSPEEAAAGIPDESVPADVQPEDDTAATDDVAAVTEPAATDDSTGIAVEPAPGTVEPATSEPPAAEPSATPAAEPAPAEPATEPAATEEPATAEPAAAAPVASEPAAEPTTAPATEPAAPAEPAAGAPAEATPPATPEKEEEEEEEEPASTPGGNA